MSESVSKALGYYGDSQTEEPERFTWMDTFFDGRSATAHARLRKPNLKSYTQPSDERLDVSYACQFTLYPSINSGWRMSFSVICMNGD